MFNELSFLTKIPELYNYDNRDTIYNDLRGEVDVIRGKIVVPQDDPTKKSVVFKNGKESTTNGIKNYYKDTIYKSSNGKYSDMNPYLKLLRDFEAKSYQSMRFQAADFAYLLNMGVYPLNRMWVLRRFNEFSSPPNNLQVWDAGGSKYGINNPEPISTLVGWVEPDKEDFFNMSFSETWVTMTERLDQVIMKILETEFGLKASSVLSVPGWSQGLLFGFMKNMGITNFDDNNIPQGKPEVLQEAAARANNADPGYGNNSTMSLTLKTSFEQKFIGDIDPGNAMLDIIYRCIKMGTRDTLFVLGNDSKGVISSLRSAAAAGNNAGLWWDFIKKTITAFTEALTEMFNNIKDVFKTEVTPAEKKPKKEETDKVTSKPVDGAGVTLIEKLGTNIITAGEGVLKSILSSTVAKWKYALMGSIALMTGENSTPWHLTIGNPYSPFVSLGNIIVEDVKLDFNNEFSFNDIPTRLNVEIRVKLGRNLGAQEIFQMFNNGYQRIYTPKKSTPPNLQSDEKNKKSENIATETANIKQPQGNIETTNKQTTTPNQPKSPPLTNAEKANTPITESMINTKSDQELEDRKNKINDDLAKTPMTIKAESRTMSDGTVIPGGYDQINPEYTKLESEQRNIKNEQADRTENRTDSTDRATKAAKSKK